MRKLTPLALGLVVIGCGGYTGDRAADYNTSLNNATNRSGDLSGVKKQSTMKDGLVYQVSEGKSRVLKLIKADGTAEANFATIPADIPAVGVDEKAGSYVFAAKAKEGEAFAIFRGVALERASATEIAPASFKTVEDIQVARDSGIVFVLGTLKDEPTTLYKLPKGIRAPISMTQASAFTVNPRGDFAVVAKKEKLELFDVSKGKSSALGKGLVGESPSFSRDGKSFVFLRKVEGVQEVFQMDREGKKEAQLTKAGKLDKSHPTYAKEVKKIIYTVTEKESPTVFVAPIDAKTPAVAIRQSAPQMFNASNPGATATGQNGGSGLPGGAPPAGQTGR